MLVVCRAAARKGLEPQAETSQRAPAVRGASVARGACPRARRSTSRLDTDEVAYLLVPFSISDTECILSRQAARCASSARIVQVCASPDVEIR